MEVYFDNSATTRVLDSVRDVVVKVMTEDYGNPSAKHRKGMEAEQIIIQAPGYMLDANEENARYQIQLSLQYFKEA